MDCTSHKYHEIHVIRFILISSTHWLKTSESLMHFQPTGLKITLLLIDDPDHMMAMKMIDEAHMQKGKIKSFTWYCGRLPSPEDANNPLAYKFRYFLECLYPCKQFSNGSKVNSLLVVFFFVLKKTHF